MKWGEALDAQRLRQISCQEQGEHSTGLLPRTCLNLGLVGFSYIPDLLTMQRQWTYGPP